VIGLENKVALVTGGSSGIGRATALTFAREGAKVVIADINIIGGEETARMIKMKGGQALFIKTDVTRATEVESLIDQTIQKYGRLDCAHNNAGMLEGIPLMEGTEAQWDRIMNLNLKSVWLCMKYELRHMTRHGAGAIVNTSSVAGLVGSPGTAFYAASKWGVNGLTKSAAVEFAKSGIRINAVCPAGIMNTTMYIAQMVKNPAFAAQLTSVIPMERDGFPEEVAEVVVWLCSDAASYITGHTLPVDGGRTAI